MTPEYILRHDSDPPHCSQLGREERALYIESMDFAPSYGEPGYSQPVKGVLFNNWNVFSRRVTDLLEKTGWAIEWQDEWAMCGGCGKALRTSADSYGWQPSYIEESGDLLCFDCADIPAYLEELENKTRKAVNNRSVDPAEHGYIKLQGEYENGWHNGQNDDPKKVMVDIRAGLIPLPDGLTPTTAKILFQINGVGQFDVSFSAWVKKPEEVAA